MKTRIAPLATAGLILLAYYPVQAGACTSDPEKLKITVTVDENGEPVVSDDEVVACVGDEIKWKFKGSGAQHFAVEFKEDSPFTWKRQKDNVNGTLKGVVKEGTARAEPYKYLAEVDGKILDPKIVVEP